MAEVEFRNVSKVYDGGVLAVADFALAVKDREFVVFVGPSGCGKSTALRMIAGLEEITSGDLLIDGKRVNDVQPKDRDIAMVFQNYALYPHMNVYDNMAFGLKLRKFSRQEIDGRVRDAAQILGLADYLHRKPKALSGGQRQRVAVGRAIVRKPKAFLFDEPLSNLDAKMRVQMRKELCQLHRRLQSTMIYVTHDQVEAMTMGDRIVVIKDGRIQQVGTPMEIYRKPANEFVAGFIGSPPMNFIDCGVSERGVEFGGSAQPMPPAHLARLRAAGARTIRLGVRPEDLSQQPVDGGFSLEGAVDLNELLGSEMLVYLSDGASHAFIAKLLNGNPLPVGRTVRFHAPWESLYYFDSASGRAL